MKKTLVLILLSAATSSHLSAQCFEQGNIVVGFGSGIGIYKTTFTNQTNTTIPAEKDTSGAVVFPISFEYGVLNWLGLGVRFGYNNYLEGKDTLGTNQNARAIDFMGSVNAHFLRTKHIDMFVSAEYGFSHFKYQEDSQYNPKAVASGTGYSFGLNTRFYFGKASRFGLNLRFALEGYNYQNGIISDDSTSNTDYKFGFKGNGKVFGIGLQYRI